MTTTSRWRHGLSREETIDGLADRAERRLRGDGAPGTGDPDGELRDVVDRAYANDSEITVSEIVEIVRTSMVRS